MKVGTKKRLNYPKELTTLPEYTAHSGQTVDVIRPLTLDEADAEVGQMYLVRAADGWEGHAYEEELEDI